jgi:FAD/FMN-containing dehydrogenase
MHEQLLNLIDGNGDLVDANGGWSALEPHHTGVYVNFLMDEGEERVLEAYGSDKYDRLKALKRRWDPDNVFRLNQNIPPD